MTTFTVGYFVGSLAKRSINRKLARALTRLAPPELAMREIPIGELPLYSQDYDADYPPPGRAHWNDRAHFLALAAVAMRHILADRAKARIAIKRGGVQHPVTLDEQIVASDDHPKALLEMDEALAQLGAIDARLATIVECRFFGGLTNEEIAQALGITVRTVERDWAKARMLLRMELAT